MPDFPGMPIRGAGKAGAQCSTNWQEARRSQQQQLRASDRQSRAKSEPLYPHLTSLTPPILAKPDPAPLSSKTARLPPPPPTQPRDDRAQRGGNKARSAPLLTHPELPAADFHVALLDYIVKVGGHGQEERARKAPARARDRRLLLPPLRLLPSPAAAECPWPPAPGELLASRRRRRLCRTSGARRAHTGPVQPAHSACGAPRSAQEPSRPP